MSRTQAWMRFEALNDSGWQACFSFWVEGSWVLMMEFPIPALQPVKDLKNTAMGGIMGLHQSNPDEGFMRAAMATSVTEICMWRLEKRVKRYEKVLNVLCHGACIGQIIFTVWVTGSVISRWDNAIKPQVLGAICRLRNSRSTFRTPPLIALEGRTPVGNVAGMFHSWFYQVALCCSHASGIYPCPQQVPEPSVGLLLKWVCLSKFRCWSVELKAKDVKDVFVFLYVWVSCTFIDQRIKLFSRSDQAPCWFSVLCDFFPQKLGFRKSVLS